MNADKNAIDAVKKGDRDRFEELVQRHKRMVYAIAWSHLGDPDTCEDAAQETFIKAFRYLGALRDAEKFPGWLSRIARNVSVSLLRKRQTELERRKRWQAEQDPPATMPTANEDQESLKEMLGKALGDLPAQQRECLVLFYIEGKSIREVASILGLNEGAVKTRLHRARQALRGMLEEQIERELHGLSPRKGFVASVMLLLPEKPLGTIGIGGGASLAGKAVSGIGKLGSTLMLGFWMVFAQTAFFYLMMRWFARMEMANLIDKPENEFRKAQLRRNLLVVTVGVLCVLALSHFGIRILGYSGFYMLLAVYCAWGVYRAILLLRVNRSSYTWGQLVSILTFLLVSVLMGFFGAPPALFFLALVILNLILFFTNRQLPRRQDYNLFLRQSQVLLHEPESDLTPSRPVSVPELKAFARFLGEQWLVWDYSIRLSSIILRLPHVRTSLTKTFFMTGTGDSFIQIKNDGNCLLRLSPIDRKAIEKLTDRPIDEDELIDKVRRTIKAALTHFLNGQKQAARHLLSPVKDDAIFKTEYSKTRGYRIQIGIALVASITLLIGSSYMGAWRWGCHTGSMLGMESQSPRKWHGRQ